MATKTPSVQVSSGLTAPKPAAPKVSALKAPKPAAPANAGLTAPKVPVQAQPPLAKRPPAAAKPVPLAPPRPPATPNPHLAPVDPSLYRQDFDAQFANDFNQWYSDPNLKGKPNRGQAFHKYMTEVAFPNKRITGKAREGYNALVAAVNSGQMTTDQALAAVKNYVDRETGKHKQKAVGRTGPRKVTARLFSKGGAVEKRAAPRKKPANAIRVLKPAIRVPKKRR